MSGPTTYTRQRTYNDLFRDTPIYLALYIPDGLGGLVEISTVDTGYARAQIIASAPDVNGDGFNENDIAIGPALADWSDNITHYAIFDALNGGNQKYFDELDFAQAVRLGGTFELPAGDIILRVGRAA